MRTRAFGAAVLAVALAMGPMPAFAAGGGGLLGPRALRGSASAAPGAVVNTSPASLSPLESARRELGNKNCPGFDVGTKATSNDVMVDGVAEVFDKSSDYATYADASNTFFFKSATASHPFSLVVQATQSPLGPDGDAECAPVASITNGTAGATSLPVTITYNCKRPGKNIISVQVVYTGCQDIPARLRTFTWVKTHGTALIVGTAPGWSDVVDKGVVNPTQWSNAQLQTPSYGAYVHNVTLYMQVHPGFSQQPLFPGPPSASAGGTGVASPFIDYGGAHTPTIINNTYAVKMVVQFNCKNSGSAIITVDFHSTPFAPASIAFAIHCRSLPKFAVSLQKEPSRPDVPPVVVGGFTKDQWVHNQTVRTSEITSDTFVFANTAGNFTYHFPASVLTVAPEYAGASSVSYTVSGDINPGTAFDIPPNSQKTMVVTYKCDGVNSLTQFTMFMEPQYALKLDFGWAKACGTRPGWQVTWTNSPTGPVDIINDGAVQAGWGAPGPGKAATKSMDASFSEMVLSVVQHGPFPAFHLHNAIQVSALTTDKENVMSPVLEGPMAGDDPVVPSTPTTLTLQLWSKSTGKTPVVSINMSTNFFGSQAFAFNVPVNWKQHVSVVYGQTTVADGGFTPAAWAGQATTVITQPAQPQFSVVYSNDYGPHPGSAKIGIPIARCNDTALCKVGVSGPAAQGGVVSMTASNLALNLDIACLNTGAAAAITVTVPILADAGGSYTPMKFQFTYQTVNGVPGQVTGITAKAGDTTATVNFKAPPSFFPFTQWIVRQYSPAGTNNITATLNMDVKSVKAFTPQALSITGLTNGQTYQFAVAGVSQGGTGAWSDRSPSVTPAHSAAIWYIFAAIGGAVVLGLIIFAVVRWRRRRAEYDDSYSALTSGQETSIRSEGSRRRKKKKDGSSAPGAASPMREVAASGSPARAEGGTKKKKKKKKGQRTNSTTERTRTGTTPDGNGVHMRESPTGTYSAPVIGVTEYGAEKDESDVSLGTRLRTLGDTAV